MASGTMEKYCGSAFWNSTLSWYTTDPDLTSCFERTVLVWVPCLFLWTFSCLEVYYILNSKNRNVPWSWVNITKLIGLGVLVILSATDLVTNAKASSDSDVHNVDIYTPLVKLLTFVLSAGLLYFNKKYGLSTSGLQFLFWLLLSICGAFQFRSEFRANQNSSDYNHISYLVYYPIVLIMLLLNCFADKPASQSEHPRLKNPCPEECSSFLSRLLFSWFDPLAWRGFRRPLIDTDLWDMRYEDSAAEVVPLFEKHFKNTLAKCESTTASLQMRASYKLDSARVDIVNSSPKKKKQASILPALIKAFGPTFIFGALLKLIQDLLTFVSPQILNLLIKFVREGEEQWKGYFYAALLFITATIQTIILSQYFNRMFIVGMRIRTALVSAIYRKALRVSNKARKESTVGEIVNLMSVDAQKFIDLTAYINMIWSAPLQIILALYFLWDILGPSVLAGLAVMIILIPINGWIANKVKSLQIRQMKNKDERVKLMNEVLGGIKVLKLYAWEPSFENQILKIRAKEIQVLKEAAYMNAGTSFIWSCAPFLVSLTTFGVFIYSDSNNKLTAEIAFVSIALFNVLRMPISFLPMLLVYAVQVSLVSFATYVMVDEKNVLDASKAFVSVSLFNILRFPLSMLPMMISNMVQAAVSVGRINKFMNAEELDPTSVTHNTSETAPLIIENGSFSWGDDPILKNISLRLEEKTLSAVVGTVGSGKSSLVSAFLGEMDKTTGTVNTIGSIAYVAQQAWIQNASLKDNILFGKPYNKELYEKVIDSCALKPDFQMLPAGDQTEIGEKGINLSGGQKQRVSLARAVYADSDIYFLDDPLSAVDSHVGKHIFDNVIGPEGLLKNKTRVLVTHGITYLPQTDKVIVLKDGEVSEIGTYQELLDKKGAFSEFLLQHINEVEENEEELDVLKSQLSGTAVSEEINKKLIRARSRVSESVSETGSDHTNPSLQRQKSTDSGDRSLRQRSSSVVVEDVKKGAQQAEKLIEVEKAETGSVKWAVYKHYLKSIGWFLTIATIILNMVFQGFSIGSNVWLGIWADDKDMQVNGTTDTSKRDFYLGVYGALGIGQVILSIFSDLAPELGSFIAAYALHQQMLTRIFRAPMWFFDTTPLGRILSRFAKDIDAMDNVIPYMMVAAIFFTFEYFIVLAILAYVVFLMDVGAELGCHYAANKLHKFALKQILLAPVRFFETTPRGRILSRFSKDVEIMDNVLPEVILACLGTFYQLSKAIAMQCLKLIIKPIKISPCLKRTIFPESVFVNFLGIGSLFSGLAPDLGCLQAARELHKYLLTAIMRSPISFFDRTPIGRILSRFSKDVEIMDNTLPLYFVDGLYCLFEVIGTLVVISYTTPIFIAVVVPIGILYYFIQRFYVATSRQLKRLESVSRSPIYSHFGETITGVQAIRAYREQDRFIRESENKVDTNQICYYPSIISNRWLAVRLEMIGNLIILFAALFAVIGKDQNPGLVGLSVTYSLQITQTLNWLVRMTSDVETNIVAVERIKEYGEAPQEAAWEIPNKNPSNAWPENGAVQFNNFSVRYRPGLDLVLKGVNFNIKGGEKVGIVGRTGAGKSSLTLALFRIIEAADGEILIDNVNIAGLGLHTLRARLTIIPQDAVLFSGSLRMNLDPFDKHTDEEVWRSLELAHLKSFVKGLTAGLHHEVTEGGENLSVGQRQLICLSRALLRKTKVLILDEATAAVDLETDDLIQKTIRSEFKDCTVLTIAHRLNTIMDSDRVIVLDQGRIVEFDTPSNLLKRPTSIFLGMCKDAGLA